IRRAPNELSPRQALVAVLHGAKRYERAAELLDGWLKEHAAAAAKAPAAGKPGTDGRPAAPTRPAGKAPPAATRPSADTRPVAPTRPAAGTRPVVAPWEAMPPEAVPWCRDALVASLVVQQRYAEAMKRADTYLRDDPDHIPLLNAKSTCLSETGKPVEALALLEKVHRLASSDLAKASEARPAPRPDEPGSLGRAQARVAMASNNLSYVYAEQGVQLERAQALAEQAIELRANPAVRDTLGWVYYKRGRFPQAGTVFLELLRDIEGTEEQHPVMFDHAGDVLYRLGWKDRAVKLWRRALTEAKKEQPPTTEIRTILETTPKKIQAVTSQAAKGRPEQTKPPPVAPLGKGVKEPPGQ
ncbi:MAG TPA: hypothetical protein VFJ30_14940, partial [Phycisphaerae bacterium]|nr:hypothetical protein [Phycisphaerae bacterium]